MVVQRGYACFREQHLDYVLLLPIVLSTITTRFRAALLYKVLFNVGSVPRSWLRTVQNERWRIEFSPPPQANVFSDEGAGVFLWLGLNVSTPVPKLGKLIKRPRAVSPKPRRTFVRRSFILYPINTDTYNRPDTLHFFLIIYYYNIILLLISNQACERNIIILW